MAAHQCRGSPINGGRDLTGMQGRQTASASQATTVADVAGVDPRILRGQEAQGIQPKTLRLNHSHALRNVDGSAYLGAHRSRLLRTLPPVRAEQRQRACGGWQRASGGIAAVCECRLWFVVGQPVQQAGRRWFDAGTDQAEAKAPAGNRTSGMACGTRQDRREATRLSSPIALYGATA